MTFRLEEHVWHLGPIGDHGAYPFERTYKNQAGANSPRTLRLTGNYTENWYNAIHEHQIDEMASASSWLPPYSRSDPVSSFGGSFTFPDPGTPTLLDVLPKLATKWKSSEFNAGVFIAEGKESVEMITSRLLALTRAARALKRGNLGDAFRSLAFMKRGQRRRINKKLKDGSDLADIWLEMRYGWLPLYFDIAALAEMVRLEPRQGVIRSSAKKSLISLNLNQGFVGHSECKKNERRLHVKIRVTHTASMLERLGLTDPLSIAWEVVPFSFVTDWFLPINDYLESLHAIAAMPVDSYVETQVRAWEGSTTYLPGDHSSYYTYTNAAKFYQQHVGMQRLVDDELPSTLTLLSRLPKRIKPKWDISLMHMFDAIALNHQQFSRFIR